ncbi:MAG: helix-turn-helix domain-containing protein [Proteobacteria bacterium]|nr:helix-turn-helix domain-containing protein [Pseudomonadota bacterium]
MATSARTLQRHLRREGCTMHEVVDQVRRERALALLTGSTSIAAVAHELGYSESSAFHRAFKRWTGSRRGFIWSAPDPRPHRPFGLQSRSRF